MRSVLLASVLALAPIAAAQSSCGTLAITGSGAAGTTLDIGLTGATANAFALVFVGENTGTTAIRLGPIRLDLGLATPFFPVPLGRTDANGDASQSFTVPNAVMQQYALNAQAATVTLSIFPFRFSGCTSNVVPFTIG